ncbi:Uncharacterised protein [Serratia fonticola]|jgi:hypothetical protein|nr:Uncharacterised protein [Serratia fonticola]
MEISDLSQARSNTVSKLLNAPDFAALLVAILHLFSQCPFEQLRQEVAQNPALPAC